MYEAECVQKDAMVYQFSGRGVAGAEIEHYEECGDGRNSSHLGLARKVNGSKSNDHLQLQPNREMFSIAKPSIERCETFAFQILPPSTSSIMMPLPLPRTYRGPLSVHPLLYTTIFPRTWFRVSVQYSPNADARDTPLMET
jgi:hypothetical protein